MPLLIHEGITIKTLLDSGTTGMFIDKRIAARHGFKLQKLERLIMVRNMDRKNNSGRAIMHQVECNVSQLCYRPVVTYCMVYYYTKRATLARLLANKGPAIYVVHLNRYFVIPP